MANEISLNDIINSNPVEELNSEPPKEESRYSPVDPSAILPTTDYKAVQKNAEKEVMGEVLEGVGRKLDQMRENRDKMKESIIDSMEEEELEKSIDNEDSSTTNISKDEDADLITSDEEVEAENFDSTDENLDVKFIDSDLEELEKELTDSINEEPEEFTDEDLRLLAEDIKQHVKPVKNEIDLSTFTVSGDSISGARVINMMSSVIEKRNNTYADWVLVDTGRVISMRSFDSDDLDKLQRVAFRTPLNAVTETWQLLYDHCVDQDKPSTMEKWIDGISSLDIPHIYACVYKASFQDSSYIPFTCTNKECAKPFMPGATEFNELVKYQNAEAKEYVQGIFNGTVTTTSFNNEELLQVSDDIAVGIRKPSIYNVIFENLAVDDKTRRKFNDALNIINYINNIYYIDRNTMTLKPVKYKKFVDNRNKTIKSKLLTYSTILKTLDSDQKGLITGKISTLIKDGQDKVTYIFPAVTCKHCGHSISEQETDPQNLLFTRHRLTALMT